MRKPILLVAIVLSACAGTADEASDPTPESAPPLPAVDSVSALAHAAPDLAPTPWYDEEDCGFVRVQTHPDPDSLIAQYLRRDATRAEVQVDEWFASAVACPDHEGGPDMYGLAAGYETRGVERADSVVAVEVTTRQLGSVGFDSAGQAELFIDTATVRDTVRALQTPFGWRIDGPAFRLAVHPHAPLARSHLSSADSARLAALMATAP